MRGRTLLITAAVAASSTIGLIVVNGHASRKGSTTRNLIGPDVVAWTIGGQNNADIDYYGSSNGIGGYAIATQSCNWGDEVLDWYGGTNQSPIIMSNMFRLKDGRFEQIGLQAFMKHSFCALSEPGCGDCQSTNCDTLGIGCADTYWAGLNSNGECPRSDVNGFTGAYPYPFTQSPSGPSSIRGNIQVLNVDVDPAQNAGARYFIEAQYIAQDDQQAGNGDNNASWREIGFNSISDPYVMDSDGATETHAGEPAIQAWADIDPSVRLGHILVPDDGKILIGSKITDNGDGTYSYEYAIHNLNNHRSIQSVTIPTGNATISSVGFKDIDYNSGEIYDNTDWTSNVTADSVTWYGPTFEQNPNGNALRWGTTYNFSFVATAAPASGDIECGIFKPGGASSFSASSIIPGGGATNDPCDQPLGDCPEDVDASGIVAVGDILATVANWGDCGDGTYRPLGDVDGDCCVTVADLLQIIGAWGNDCAPTGACCLPGGGCSDAVTESVCVAAQGDFQGADSNCSTSNCPDPGACCFDDGTCQFVMATDCSQLGGGFQGEGTNCKSANCTVAGEGDECSGALIATNGANAFNTSTATPSDPQPDASQCSGSYLDWDNSQDVWFKYVPTQSGNVHFTTCDGNSYDTSMVLYENSCDNQVACNGDGSGDSGCQDYYSAFDYDVIAGESYYIRLGGWQGATGEGTLTLN
jgi:hypothetical protein